MTRGDQRRRSYIVNKPLQYRFLAIILIYCLTIVLFLAIFLFVPDIIRMQDENLSLEARAGAANKILTLHARVWPAVIAIICVAGFHSFRSFHRLIGPLHRFRSVFEQVGKGQLIFRVKIREKDYLHQEEAALNEMLGMIAGKIKSIQQAGSEALKSLGELEGKMNEVPNWSETHKAAMRHHRQRLEKLLNTAQYFSLSEAEEKDDGTSA
ncbi:MAG: methyl-accepting chemotaxis protein [Deltaproteobacteria bacterium]|nr:MAG: methyl-accepting chemotaxis protein [Deltaproteobacteria bacterium]